MGISPYAAIVIGSKNMLMKVYEISGGKGFRTVDEIRYEYELGKEAYFTRKITFAQIEEICNVLMEFQQRMREYAITEFRCYATSAIRNAKNQVSVLNQIKIRTGVDVIMLSNSELRFLMYKGIQVLDIDFNKIIEKNTAILDIGSGSVQVSLFDKQALYMTQNLDIGTVKVRGFLESVENNVLDYISVLEEYIQYEFDMFKSGYLKDKDIKNVIAIGDEIKNINRLIPELHLTDTMSYEQILYIYKKIKKASYQDIALKYGLSIEDARMVLPSVLIYKTFLERSKADTVYICATNLCDGSVVDYAQETKKIKLSHDFYQDIVADELNVKNVKFTDDVRDFTSYSFKPQLKTVGPKYGKMLGAIKAALNDIDGNAAMDELNATGALKLDVNGQEIELFKEDLLIDTAQIEGYESVNDNGITVVLDTNLSPELLEEGFVREIISKIQTMRKEADFEVMDRIKVTYEGSEKAEAVFEKNNTLIAGTCG